MVAIEYRGLVTSTGDSDEQYEVAEEKSENFLGGLKFLRNRTRLSPACVPTLGGGGATGVGTFPPEMEEVVGVPGIGGDWGALLGEDWAWGVTSPKMGGDCGALEGTDGG